MKNNATELKLAIWQDRLACAESNGYPIHEHLFVSKECAWAHISSWASIRGWPIRLGHHPLQRSTGKSRRLRLHHHEQEPQPAHAPRNHPRQPSRDHRSLSFLRNSRSRASTSAPMQSQPSPRHRRVARLWSPAHTRASNTTSTPPCRSSRRSWARVRQTRSRSSTWYGPYSSSTTSPKPDHAADALAAAITHARLRKARPIERQVQQQLEDRIRQGEVA